MEMGSVRRPAVTARELNAQETLTDINRTESLYDIWVFVAVRNTDSNARGSEKDVEAGVG